MHSGKVNEEWLKGFLNVFVCYLKIFQSSDVPQIQQKTRSFIFGDFELRVSGCTTESSGNIPKKR